MSEDQNSAQENHSFDPSKDQGNMPVGNGNQFNSPPPFQPAPPYQQFPGMGQPNLPNSTAALIMGIISIPACCCYGLGIVFGIIAWVLAAGDIKKYNLHPAAYSLSSYKNTKAGKICGIIGVALSVIYIGCLIAFVALVGWSALSDPELLKEILEQKGLK